uniref:ankyrin and armadillo repeat-containing protein isoform X3 n=1 Tax=Ciona intestinalis TaxID=7719 RepID=UPI000EF4A3A7|nr:ankyrin and armadillo repeat-containing protein isoform X3 [Ciona intestinalis]|eukprot:XP_026696049.1 ankyrin and armadillo repeat-containing protein isoform X3 [Ciona intestinalis]
MRPQSAVHEQNIESNPNVCLNLSSAPAEPGLQSTPRPATAGLLTSRSNVSTHSTSQLRSAGSAHTDGLSYFDNFNKNELRELIAESRASWLLSSDFRGQAGLPFGLISNMNLSHTEHLTLLFPKPKDVEDLEYRELHQIVRELTTGIFAMSQMPCLSLEPSFDFSSSCQMPMAYKDTRVGQILLDVDYAMKSLWHGVTVPKSKRLKLSEKWRTLLDINSATGEMNKEKNPYTEFSNAEFVRCVMSMHMSSARCCSSENVVVCNIDYDISTAVSLYDDDHIPPADTQRLRRRLRHHIKVIEKGLLADPSTRRNIALLKFIAATSIVLVALRKRLMKVPKTDSLLHPLQCDDLRTESEFPPFAFNLNKSNPCRTFTVDKDGNSKLLTHMHGELQFDSDTAAVKEIKDEQWCNITHKESVEHLQTILNNQLKLEYDVPVTLFENTKHYVINIPLTTYYPTSPPIPQWLHARYQQLSSLCSKKLIMNDIQLAELLKQVFGFRKALAHKSIEAKMRLCACRGLVAAFVTLMKKVASTCLFAPDVQGMTLLHYCCAHNKSSILSVLLNQKPNLNTRRTEVNQQTTQPEDKTKLLLTERSGVTALHISARCGSLTCVNALLDSRANPMLTDSKGWSAVHHAAAFDQTAILRCILRRYPSLLEQPATGGDNSTPLLVAASYGSLNALKFLIKLGASLMASDISGNGLIQRVILNFHSDVLLYCIELTQDGSMLENNTENIFKVWDVMIDMLKSSIIEQNAALRCMEIILHQCPLYWKELQLAGVIPPLVAVLSSPTKIPISSLHGGSSSLQSLACSVICLMSEHKVVQEEICNNKAIPVLVSLLKTPKSTSHTAIKGEELINQRYELQSRSSVVLCDLAQLDNIAARISDCGGIPPLVDLLQTDVVDVVVNSILAIAALCRGDISECGEIQNQIVKYGAALLLVGFLTVRNDALQISASDAIAALCKGNNNIQNKFVELGVLPCLVTIVKGHCIPAQMKSALAIDCITHENPHAQYTANLEKAPHALCRLFHIWSDSVKECGANALWSLAGCHLQNQKEISLLIGTKQLIEMLISKSETLQYLGCLGVGAISKKSKSGQIMLANDGTIPPLVRLLRRDCTSRKVVMAAMMAINNLCVGIACLNNTRLQELLAEENLIDLLIDKIWQTSQDETIQVDLLFCLASVVTGCTNNEVILNKNGGFGFEILLELLHSPHLEVQHKVMSALATFSFNRIYQQQKILKCGGIPFYIFNALLESHNIAIKSAAAFQLVILARVVTMTTVVDASAKGIIELVKLLDSDDDNVTILAAEYIASLAHTRAGVPDAIVQLGTVPKLVKKLKSANQQLRQAASQALGYLSFNRTASRELMAACRGTDGVYDSLINNIGPDGVVADEFVAEFKCQSAIGLPILKAHKHPA